MVLRTVVLASYEAISFDKIISQMRLLQSMKNRFRNDGNYKENGSVVEGPLLSCLLFRLIGGGLFLLAWPQRNKNPRLASGVGYPRRNFDYLRCR